MTEHTPWEDLRLIICRAIHPDYRIYTIPPKENQYAAGLDFNTRAAATERIAERLIEALQAAHVDRAVNNHARLVEALKSLLYAAEVACGAPMDYLLAARAALKAAQEE